MPTWHYIKKEFNSCLYKEKTTLPLFAPVILGIGILVGVYYPVKSYLQLFVIVLFCFILPILYIILNKLRLQRSIIKQNNDSNSIILYDDYNGTNTSNDIYSVKNKNIISNYLQTFYIKVITLLIFGFYFAQTGGILKTDLLVNKQFINKQYERVLFYADVDYIDVNHPVMKNMQRISFKNIEFINNKQLNFIKTAKMTCPSKVTKDIMPNDRVKVFATLTPLKDGIVPFSFNQKQYYAINNWDTTGIVFSINKIKSKNNINVFPYLRRILTSNIINKLGNVEGGIASSLITGDKSSIPSNIRDVFVKSGTAHILAVSGLHMIIISAILYLFWFKLMLYLQCFWLFINPRKIASCITIVLTFFYLAISGFSPSASRAFIMTTICLISIALGRGLLSMRNLSVSAFIILLFDAGSLFSVSFQLSFIAVTALVAFYAQYKSKCTDIININNGILKKITIYIVGSLITTIVATIATAPISIATFNQFSVCGVLGNIIAIPLISFLIIPVGILCLVGGYKYGFIINAFKVLISLLVKCLTYISNLPLTNITIKSPHMNTLYCIIIGGIILCLLVSKLRHVGTLLIIYGLTKWILEKNPTVIILPEYKIVCFVKDNTFYSNFKYKARNLVHAIQRNYGFSEIIKTNHKLNNIKYNYNIFVSDNNRIYTTTKSIHPYCPIKYLNINHH
ncbi:MAG: ComEC/Rec2 family competence protein [Alphaproteobacteria bacterium]|nr:ComEC/Rec2 family competence protein [Alphaproteobacteria bacterium]